MFITEFCAKQISRHIVAVKFLNTSFCVGLCATLDYAEAGKVAVRNIRRDAMDNFKKQEKKSEITEDELKQVEKDLQKLTDDSCKKLDELLAKKEKELMAV